MRVGFDPNVQRSSDDLTNNEQASSSTAIGRSSLSSCIPSSSWLTNFSIELKKGLRRLFEKIGLLSSAQASLPLVITEERHEPIPIFWASNEVINPIINIELPDVLTLRDLDHISNAVPLLNQRYESELVQSHLRLFQILPKDIQEQFLQECKRRWDSADTSDIGTLFHSYNARHLLNHSVRVFCLKYSIKTLAGYLKRQDSEQKENAFAKLLKEDQNRLRRVGSEELPYSDQKKYLFKQLALLKNFQADQPFYYFEIKAEIAENSSP